MASLPADRSVNEVTSTSQTEQYSSKYSSNQVQLSYRITTNNNQRSDQGQKKERRHLLLRNLKEAAKKVSPTLQLPQRRASEAQNARHSSSHFLTWDALSNAEFLVEVCSMPETKFTLSDTEIVLQSGSTTPVYKMRTLYSQPQSLAHVSVDFLYLKTYLVLFCCCFFQISKS